MLKRALYFLILLVAIPALVFAGKGNNKTDSGGKGGPKGGGGSTPQAVEACFSTGYDSDGVTPRGINPDNLECYADESIGGDPGLTVQVDSGTFSLTMNPDRFNFADCCFYQRHFYFDVDLPETCSYELSSQDPAVGDNEARLYLRVDVGTQSTSASASGQVVGVVWDEAANGWDTQGVLLNLDWDNVTVSADPSGNLHVFTDGMATIQEPAQRGNKKVTCGTASIPFSFTIQATP